MIEHLRSSWRDHSILSFSCVQLKGPLETSTIREEGREGSEALSRDGGKLTACGILGWFTLDRESHSLFLDSQKHPRSALFS